MHKEVLTKNQTALLPLVKSFAKDFGLAGGTAIALYLGHRESIDFDFFTNKEFDSFKIRRKIHAREKIDLVSRDEKDEFTLIVKGMRLTFFHYPFGIKFSQDFNGIIKLPDLLTLAAMKAFTLGRRAKWKDYVDLYFILRDKFSMQQIVDKAKQMFGREFNEKNFKIQLTYFKDIDYSEKISYVGSLAISDEKIKKALVDFSLS